LVLSPNPFYQLDEGAAFLAGCEPYYYPTGPESDYRPDFTAIPDQVWDDCQLIYLCSPSNPTGSVIPLETLQWLINKAEKHDFLIASDECYSEIYFDEAAPPPGLLQAAAAMGNTDYKRCVVFHSLSKRSNLPGLRSGFVAGDADVLSKFLLYRTYHGCAMAPAVQVASVAAWNDEAHVRDNRDQYREKFARVLEILQAVLDIRLPDAGFYLWPQLPLSDEDFTVKLWREQHIAVLPGSYLSREIDGNNPGRNHLRMALVAEVDECVTAAERIRAALETL
jgi:N-succinyldiaminopimelate aminotransferase